MKLTSFHTAIATVVVGLCLIFFLVDRALQIGIERFAPEEDVVDIQTPRSLLVKLERLRKFDGFKVALLGDSVVVGSALKRHGDQQWRQHNLAETLSGRLGAAMPGRDVLVMNLGIDGALPTDLEQLVRLVLPLGVDAIVCDLGLRSFSRDFSKPGSESNRPWLADIDFSAINGQFHERTAHQSLATRIETSSDTFATNHWLLYRYRDFFQLRVFDGTPSNFIEASHRKANRTLLDAPAHSGDDYLLLLLKARRRFESIDLAKYNIQVAALERLLVQLAVAGQKTVLFYAKENPAVVSELLPQENYRTLRSELDDLLAPFLTSGVIQYLPPIDAVGSEFYLDHVHVNGSANAILAEAISAKLLKGDG